MKSSPEEIEKFEKKNKELLLRVRNGDEKAKEELMLLNENLVLHIANKYCWGQYHHMIDDIVEIGKMGFLKAIKTYSFSKPTPFCLYAYACTKNEILRFYKYDLKHNVHDCISLDAPREIGDESGDCVNILSLLEGGDGRNDVENQFDLENVKYIAEYALTQNELRILNVCLNDNYRSYTEMAKNLGKTRSYVHHVVQQIAKKINVVNDHLENLTTIEKQRRYLNDVKSHVRERESSGERKKHASGEIETVENKN